MLRHWLLSFLVRSTVLQWHRSLPIVDDTHVHSLTVLVRELCQHPVLLHRSTSFMTLVIECHWNMDDASSSIEACHMRQPELLQRSNWRLWIYADATHVLLRSQVVVLQCTETDAVTSELPILRVTSDDTWVPSVVVLLCSSVNQLISSMTLVCSCGII